MLPAAYCKPAHSTQLGGKVSALTGTAVMSGNTGEDNTRPASMILTVLYRCQNRFSSPVAEPTSLKQNNKTKNIAGIGR